MNNCNFSLLLIIPYIYYKRCATFLWRHTFKTNQ
nr:MAG TPA: hypothetical protein [Caudoviricetes sp.]